MGNIYIKINYFTVIILIHISVISIICNVIILSNWLKFIKKKNFYRNRQNISRIVYRNSRLQIIYRRLIIGINIKAQQIICSDVQWRKTRICHECWILRYIKFFKGIVMWQSILSGILKGRLSWIIKIFISYKSFSFSIDYWNNLKNNWC